MCMICNTSDLPSHEKGAKKKSFISMFLKPNKEGEMYRFRLLFYRQKDKNDRQDAFIVQKIHDHWGTSPKGNKVVDDLVVCPGSDYVTYDERKFILNPKTNKNELNCPICKKARENMSAYMNSGKTDKMSIQKYYQLKSKERLCFPVYVINDPNTIGEDGTAINNKKFKVLILTNPDDIKAFKTVFEEERKKIYFANKEGNGYEMFNSNAVDLYIRMENVPEIRNEGKSNEYTSNVRKITQIAFGKKVSKIDDIDNWYRSGAANAFEFDDQFYFSNTKSELEEFYKKHYGQSDVSPEEEDVFGTTSTATVVKNDDVEAPKIDTINHNTVEKTDIHEDLQDLLKNELLDDDKMDEPSELFNESEEHPIQNEDSTTSTDEMKKLLAELDV